MSGSNAGPGDHAPIRETIEARANGPRLICSIRLRFQRSQR